MSYQIFLKLSCMFDLINIIPKEKIDLFKNLVFLKRRVLKFYFIFNILKEDYFSFRKQNELSELK